MTVYTHIKNCLDKLGEKPADILKGFADIGEDLEFLKIVFGEPDETALASKISKHKKYLANGGDQTYLFGTQPRTQQAYLDRNKPTGKKSKDTFRESVAIAGQAGIPVEVWRVDTELYSRLSTNLLGEIHDGFDPLQQFSNLEQFLTEVAKHAGYHPSITKYIERIAKCIQDHIVVIKKDGDYTGKDEYNYSIDKDILKSKRYKALPPFQQFLVRQFVRLIAVLGYLSQDIPEGKDKRDVLLLRDEIDLAYMMLNTIPRTEEVYKTTSAIQRDFNKALDDSSMPIWSVDNHGQYIDSRFHEQLGSKEHAKRVFPYNGALYEFNEKTKSMTLASTREMQYKRQSAASGLIITLDGQIHTFNHAGGAEADTKKFHSMITGGRSVLFAGSIKIDSEGNIIEITDTSGHYKPRITLELLLFLEQNDLLHSGIRFVEDGNFNCNTVDTIFYIFHKPSTKAYLEKYFAQNGYLGLQHLINIVNKHASAQDAKAIIKGLVKQYAEKHEFTKEQLKENITIFAKAGLLYNEDTILLLGDNAEALIRELIENGTLQDVLHLIDPSITGEDYLSGEALDGFLSEGKYKGSKFSDLPDELQIKLIDTISEIYIQEEISLDDINRVGLNEDQIIKHLLSDDLINKMIIRGDISGLDSEPFNSEDANGLAIQKIIDMANNGTLSEEALNKFSEEDQQKIQHFVNEGKQDTDTAPNSPASPLDDRAYDIIEPSEEVDTATSRPGGGYDVIYSPDNMPNTDNVNDKTPTDRLRGFSESDGSLETVPSANIDEDTGSLTTNQASTTAEDVVSEHVDNTKDKVKNNDDEIDDLLNEIDGLLDKIEADGAQKAVKDLKAKHPKDEGIERQTPPPPEGKLNSEGTEDFRL